MGAILFLIIGLSIQMKAWVNYLYWFCYGSYLVCVFRRLYVIGKRGR